jgi:hypothetical protein
MGQEGVLLGFVPAVDFVDKEGGALAVEVAPFLGFGDGFSNLGDAGEDGVDGDEVAAGAVGDDGGEGGFAGSGGAVEDERGELVSLDRSAKEAAWPNDVFLTGVLIKSTGPHSVGKRGFFFNLGLTAVFKEVYSFNSR